MRTVDGYVCVAHAGDGRVWLFGKNVHYDGLDENFEFNGLVPFKTIDEARWAKQKREEHPEFTNVHVKRIRMEVMERDDEISFFVGKISLVAIQTPPNMDDRILYGAIVPGRATSMSCNHLTDNGLTPFPDFASATRAADEIRRQSLCPVALATFSLQSPSPSDA
jgi:hypothetical protein